MIEKKNVPVMGNNYWILTDLDHELVLNQKDFEALKPCVFIGIIDTNGWERYRFQTQDGENFDLNIWEVSQWVFKTVDAYLYYLVAHLETLKSIDEKYKFDDFLINKIMVSRENHPEIWI